MTISLVADAAEKVANMVGKPVTILDTTLRDGEQTQGVSFTPEEKFSIAKLLLDKVKVDRLEITSARVSDGEKKAVKLITDWASAHGFIDKVEILGFVDGKRSVDWIRSCGGRVLNLLAKGSEKHCHEQLRTTLLEHIASIRETVAYALSQGLMVNVYFEDWSNGYIESPQYVYTLAEALSACGITHVMLPDTLGVMSPDAVYRSVKDMVERFPTLQFDFHPHNDYGLATANVLAAVKAGISSVHCTVNCLGERAGNASLAQVVVALRDTLGVALGVDEQYLIDASEMVERFSGKVVGSNAPVVGADVFTQTAGIHADGDQKGGLYESRLCPERFARTRSYALGKLSGKASLVKNLEALDITLSAEQQKKVLSRIIELGDSKEQITQEDLPFIIADVLHSGDQENITLVNCSATSALGALSSIDISVEVSGKLHQAVASGNGEFDAFRKAIDRILAEYGLALPTLVNYEIHIPRGGLTDALTEARITWCCEVEHLPPQVTTRGVHSNQVFAAINAAMRVLNLLFRV